ncbi:hypothetical protein ACK3TF_005449 [Chlorella vulgaris]
MWMEKHMLANFDGKEYAAYIQADPLQRLPRLVKTAVVGGLHTQAQAAGIFHRREVPITAVKEHLNSSGIPARTA